MEHFIEIRVKHLPATNHRDYRTKLILPRWNNKSITISANNRPQSEVIQTFFDSNCINPIGYCAELNINLYLFDFKEVEKILIAFNLGVE